MKFVLQILAIFNITIRFVSIKKLFNEKPVNNIRTYNLCPQQ